MRNNKQHSVSASAWCILKLLKWLGQKQWHIIISVSCILHYINLMHWSGLKYQSLYPPVYILTYRTDCIYTITRPKWALHWEKMCFSVFLSCFSLHQINKYCHIFKIKNKILPVASQKLNSKRKQLYFSNPFGFILSIN